jgi:hypothetical protein
MVKNGRNQMRLTKTLLAATVASVVAGAAVAGGFAEEIVEPTIVPEPEAETSSWGIILPLAALGLLVALAVSSDDSDDESAD